MELPRRVFIDHKKEVNRLLRTYYSSSLEERQSAIENINHYPELLEALVGLLNEADQIIAQMAMMLRRVGDAGGLSNGLLSSTDAYTFHRNATSFIQQRIPVPGQKDA